MPALLNAPFTAALASAAIFVLLSVLGFHGLFLMFSAIPLLYIGYSLPFAPVIISAAITGAILLLFNPFSSLFYIAAIAVPCFFVLAHVMRGHCIIAAIADIGGYAIVSFSLIHLAVLDQGGIPAILSNAFDLSTMVLDPKLLEQLSWLVSNGSYLLIGMIVWWAVMFLLFSLWLLAALQKNTKIIIFRPLSPTSLPKWSFAVLILAIGVGFTAPENIRFLGLLAFVIMLLPYFFLGVMNTPLKKAMEAGSGWSLIISVVMMVLAWPAMMIATLGVMKHTQQLIIKE